MLSVQGEGKTKEERERGWRGKVFDKEDEGTS